MPTPRKYFSTTKKGELYELRQDLSSNKEEKKKEAVKHLIASMTVGKDVSSLFTEVLNCIQTNNLELKKLVYLYIMNYAKLQPERAILAVNTFRKDSNDKNPLIRALAIRTMSCIRVNEVIEYLCEPLRCALTDPDPYVLKEAALCVAKLHDISPKMVKEQGFLTLLQNLLGSPNPMVVVNTVSALSEINAASKNPTFTIKKVLLFKLLTIFEECTEWGQISIFNILMSYVPQSSLEASNICSRIAPRLQHANGALVLACVRVLVHFMNFIYSPEINANLCQKLAPPLVTLLSDSSEIQYVVLRNISLIIQVYPTIFQSSLSIFYCKYNDNSYVKAEKLEILVLLMNNENYNLVLSELQEYIREADVDFVRKSIHAIGRCAIKLKITIKRVMELLVESVKTKVFHILQDVAVVTKDILRRYPDQFYPLVPLLCEDIEVFSELDARVSIIWIIGEYAHLIKNAHSYLEPFLGNLLDEPPQIQLQLLTSSMKIHLKQSGDDSQALRLVQSVLDVALQMEHPDVRDRAYIYSRLLSADPASVREIVLAERPLVIETVKYLTPCELEILLPHISMLASVYHKPPEAFVSKRRVVNNNCKSGTIADKSANSSLLDHHLDESLTTSHELDSPSGVDHLYISEYHHVLDASVNTGVGIDAGFVRLDKSKLHLHLVITSQLDQPIYGPFLINFAPNYIGLMPIVSEIRGVLLPNQTLNLDIPCCHNNDHAPFSEYIHIFLGQVIKDTYLDVPLPVYVLFREHSHCSQSKYLQRWESIQNEHVHTVELNRLFSSDQKCIIERLVAYNIFQVVMIQGEDDSINYYMFAQMGNNCKFLFEFTFLEPFLTITLKTDELPLRPHLNLILSQLTTLVTHVI